MEGYFCFFFMEYYTAWFAKARDGRKAYWDGMFCHVLMVRELN